MKLYLNLNAYQARKLFQEISDIKSFISVKLYLLEYLLTFWKGNKKPIRPYVYVDIDQTYRAFIVNSNGQKIISFGFEFKPKINNFDIENPDNFIEEYNFLGQNGRVCLSDISQCRTILSLLLNSDNKYCYSVLDYDEDISESSINLFEYLLFKEPGYIRYDHDTIGYQENTHPIDHFDINYSKGVHFKLGLREDIQLEDFKKLCKQVDGCPEIKLISRNYPSQVSKKRKSVRKRRKKKR